MKPRYKRIKLKEHKKHLENLKEKGQLERVRIEITEDDLKQYQFIAPAIERQIDTSGDTCDWIISSTLYMKQRSEVKPGYYYIYVVQPV